MFKLFVGAVAGAAVTVAGIVTFRKFVRKPVEDTEPMLTIRESWSALKQAVKAKLWDHEHSEF